MHLQLVFAITFVNMSYKQYRCHSLHMHGDTMMCVNAQALDWDVATVAWLPPNSMSNHQI